MYHEYDEETGFHMVFDGETNLELFRAGSESECIKWMHEHENEMNF